jgi:hypothetical protein
MGVPTSLFRYQRFSGWLRSVLVNGELYFPLLHELNDPCEYCYHIDTSWDEEIARSEIRELLGRKPSKALRMANPGLDIDAQLASMRSMPFEQLVETIRRGALSQTVGERRAMIEAQMRIDAQTIGISCLTECGNSSYMSNFYAGQHTGVCLEFSGRKAPFARALPVQYQAQPPRMRIIGDPEIAHRARMFVKSMDWAQEREWRVINHREVDGCVVNFDPNALLSITLCLEFDDRNLESMRTWLAERLRLGHHLPDCYRFSRRQESYELERVSFPLSIAA